jgi:putative sporulation protein YyaC
MFVSAGSFRLPFPFLDKQSFSLFYDEHDVCNQLSKTLDGFVPSDVIAPIVLICIGSDRSTGDSLGPLVGSKLEERKMENFHLYGTLEKPVHALNLEETITSITEGYTNPYIIAIDACLGKTQHVGSITIGKGPCKPGAAMNKNLPSIGNVHIHGIVNTNGFMEFFVLQNTRLHLVMKMAHVIAASIHKTDRMISYRKKMKEMIHKE